MRPSSTLSLAALCAGLAATPLAAQNVFILDELVFSASLTDVARDRTGVTTQVITEDELRDAGNVQLSSFLARQPGISVTQNGGIGGTTTVRLRGAGPQFTAVYIDGILVNDPTATNAQFNGFSSLSTSSIKRVEIIRGSQSALYGGSAVAGVISITTQNSATEFESGAQQSYQLETGSYGTVIGSYNYTERFDDLSLSFGVNAARSDGFSAAEENNGNSEADSFRSNGQNFMISYDLSPSITIGINGFREASRGEFDEFANGGPVDGTVGDETNQYRQTGLRAFAQWQTQSWDHEFSLAEMNVDRSLESVGSFASSFKGTRQTASYQATTDRIRNLNLTLGAEFREESARSNSTSGAITPVTTHAGFAEGIWSPRVDFDLSLGLRYEEYSTFGDQTSARIAAAFRPTDQLTLRASYADGFRAPSLSESIWQFDIFGGQYVGNSNLRPESSESAELGLAYEFQSGSMIEATLFQLKIEDFIRYEDCTRVGGVCAGGSQATSINATGTTTFKGLELAASAPITERATLSATYIYTDAREQSGIRVTRVPYNTFTLGVDAEIGADWQFAGTMRHVDNLLDRATVIGDNYTVFDTTLSRQIRENTELYFRVENLTDHQYQTTRGYGTSDRAFYIGVRGTF
jgi:vitamin B12 transporter